MTSQRNFRGYSEEGAGKRTWLSQDLLKPITSSKYGF